MLIADSNPSVWFDANSNQSQVVVVPYVEWAREARLEYQLNVVNTGRTGTSNVSQGGTISVSPGRIQAVSTVQVAPQVGGRCEVDLTLREGDKEIGRYSYDCTAKK